MFLTVLCLILVLLLLAYIIIPYHYRSFHDLALIRKIPGERSYPFIGNAHRFGSLKNVEFLPHLMKLCATFTPVLNWNVLGQFQIAPQNVEDIEKILGSSQHISKSIHYRFLKPWLRTGLLTSTGSKWHARRKLLTPAFHFKILEEYMPVFNRNAAILVDKLWEHINDPFIPINSLITLCTLDIICETAMGIQINSQHGQTADYVKAVHRICELIQLRHLTIYHYNDLPYSLTSQGREQVRLLKTLHTFSEKVIRERRAEYRDIKKANSEKKIYKRRLAFLDLLIEVSENEQQLSDIDIQEEVDTFMFEGHDTISAAISWAFHTIGSHPDVQEKVIEELDVIFGDSDRPATYDDLQQMKYLDRVIKETLRLYPSVPLIGRRIDTEIELSGYTIPADSNIVTIPYILHRNPKLYPDPSRFDPDRFLPDVVQGRHPFAYLPFSAGPRNCIGQRFAIMEEKVVLSSVLRNFRVHSLEDETTIQILSELVLRPKDPLRIKFIPRK